MLTSIYSALLADLIIWDNVLDLTFVAALIWVVWLGLQKHINVEIKIKILRPVLPGIPCVVEIQQDVRLMAYVALKVNHKYLFIRSEFLSFHVIQCITLNPQKITQINFPFFTWIIQSFYLVPKVVYFSFISNTQLESIFILCSNYISYILHNRMHLKIFFKTLLL